MRMCLETKHRVRKKEKSKTFKKFLLKFHLQRVILYFCRTLYFLVGWDKLVFFPLFICLHFSPFCFFFYLNIVYYLMTCLFFSQSTLFFFFSLIMMFTLLLRTMLECIVMSMEFSLKRLFHFMDIFRIFKLQNLLILNAQK